MSRSASHPAVIKQIAELCQTPGPGDLRFPVGTFRDVRKIERISFRSVTYLSRAGGLRVLGKFTRPMTVLSAQEC